MKEADTAVSFDSEPPSAFAGGCVTIGNFDGVHLGHRELLRNLRQMSDGLGTHAVAVTFWPHPAQVLAGRPPASLLPLNDRVRMLLSQGADAVWVCPFDLALAGLEAAEFLDRVLVSKLSVRGVVVGPDFRFGAGRTGSGQLLERFACEQGIRLSVVPPCTVDGIRVSSSEIRSAVAKGLVDEAGRFLGRFYRVKGRVVHGAHLGTGLGYPTANIEPSREVVLPGNGVYVVRMRLGDAPALTVPLEGVASVGTRPTIDDGPVRIEVHLFDFEREVYGESATVEFLHRLRGETRFESVQQLIEQIRQDVQDARAFFALKG